MEQQLCQTESDWQNVTASYIQRDAFCMDCAKVRLCLRNLFYFCSRKIVVMPTTRECYGLTDKGGKLLDPWWLLRLWERYLLLKSRQFAYWWLVCYSRVVISCLTQFLRKEKETKSGNMSLTWKEPNGVNTRQRRIIIETWLLFSKKIWHSKWVGAFLSC